MFLYLVLPNLLLVLPSLEVSCNIYMEVVISDPRHTEYSNLTEARWA